MDSEHSDGSFAVRRAVDAWELRNRPKTRRIVHPRRYVRGMKSEVGKIDSKSQGDTHTEITEYRRKQVTARAKVSETVRIVKAGSFYLPSFGLPCLDIDCALHSLIRTIFLQLSIHSVASAFPLHNSTHQS